jgi:hypothetical protein
MRGRITSATDPASKSSRSRVMSELSSYEKESQSVSRYINARKKLVNDKEVVVFSMDGDCYGPGKLPQEFTSFSKFKAHVNDQLDAIEKALM